MLRSLQHSPAALCSFSGPSVFCALVSPSHCVLDHFLIGSYKLEQITKLCNLSTLITHSTELKTLV